MGEERKVCELIPTWEQIEAGVLYGTVQVYADFIVDGVTHQADPEVGIAFYRDGDTPDRCFGTPCSCGRESMRIGLSRLKVGSLCCTA